MRALRESDPDDVVIVIDSDGSSGAEVPNESVNDPDE